MSWLYLMKERAKVFSKFLSFANEIKTQHSAVIKKFRSHNALEYLSSNFKQYFDPHGIIHKTSCAYTPQHNGLAGRKHRHLLEVTWSLMIEKSVPKHHWSEALLPVCYLINRMSSSSLHDAIRIHLLFPDS